MRVAHEVEVTLNRYLLFSQASVLAAFERSKNRKAAFKNTLSYLSAQIKFYDLDVYTHGALIFYSEGVKENAPLLVILAKIETHRLYILHLLEQAGRNSRQPVSDSSVYISDCTSEIRTLLKYFCARQLRVFLLSYRKSIRRLTLPSPHSESFPEIPYKNGRIAPAA